VLIKGIYYWVQGCNIMQCRYDITKVACSHWEYNKIPGSEKIYKECLSGKEAEETLEKMEEENK